METWNVFEIVIRKKDGQPTELGLLTDNGVGKGPYIGSYDESTITIKGKDREVTLAGVNSSVIELLKSGHTLNVLNLDEDKVEPVSLM